MSQSQKHCVYCHSPFTPNPRTARHQKTCSKSRCQKKRKAESNAKFARDNPGYFRGRYRETKTWLTNHPGYLAHYRAAHPEYRDKNRLYCQKRRSRLKRCREDIQAVIRRRKITRLRGLENDDIQVVIRQQIDGLFDILTPHRRDDIQVLNAF